VTSAINPIAAGASGTGAGNTNANVYHPTYGWIGVDENVTGVLYYGSRLFEGPTVKATIIRNANKLTPSAFPWSSIGAVTGTAAFSDNSNVAYNSNSGVRTNVIVWALDAANFSDIKQIAFEFSNITPGYRELNLLIDFNELQRKDSGYELRLTLTRTIEQVLG
jgi:hypothetical protein